jgi:CBS domain-containing protein
MTEKLARRGVSVRTEYAADHLSHVMVRDAASRDIVTLRGRDTLSRVRAWLASSGEGTSHQGFPVLDDSGALMGVLTRRDLLDPACAEDRLVASLVRRRPAVAYEDSTLRDAADHMVLEKVGRLPVVERARPTVVTGMLSRSDLLAAHATRLDAAHRVQRGLDEGERLAASG